jgi:hypothetical protein
LIVTLVRNGQQRRQAEADRQTYRAEVRQRMVARDRQQLRLTAQALAWAVSNALIREQTDDINSRFNALIRERGLKELLLVDPAGTVTVSTNKKSEGAPFAARYPAELLQTNELLLTERNNQYEVAAPVQSLERRLGTLVLVYAGVESVPADSSAVR